MSSLGVTKFLPRKLTNTKLLVLGHVNTKWPVKTQGAFGFRPFHPQPGFFLDEPAENPAPPDPGPGVPQSQAFNRRQMMASRQRTLDYCFFRVVNKAKKIYYQ